MKKIVVCIMITALVSMAGCMITEDVTERPTEKEVTVMEENESTEETTEATTEENSKVSSSEETAESQENQSKKDYIPESELISSRIREYGTDEIDLDEIKENINPDNARKYCNRKDNAIESYVPYVSGFNFGMNYDVRTGEILDFKDIWQEDVDIYELLKPYLVENTTRKSVAENYEEIIYSMEEHPGFWYWYMDSTGIIITFRRHVICHPEQEYFLEYSEWSNYLKNEYLPDMDEIIGRLRVNKKIEIQDGQLEIIDDPKLSDEAFIRTDKSVILFGELYGDCLNAYIMNHSESGYYLLINSAGETQVDDGSILVYHILDGVVTECDNIPLAGVYDVKGFDNITLISGQYRLNENGKLVPVN